MRFEDQESAASAFVYRVQAVGTGPALAEVEEQVEARVLEQAARWFASHPGHWTGAEVAEELRRWRWR